MTSKIIKKDPTAQATHILKSYLKAVEIPFTSDEQDRVLVTTKTGETLTLVVGSGEATVTSLRMDPAELASFKLQRSLKAFHAATEAAGYGKPMPVNRGQPTKKGRINYNDNYEDVYLRHSIFERSPNMKEDAFAPYMKTVEGAARRAMYRWKNVFQAMGFGQNDLLNVGLVYTNSFLHNYASDKAGDVVENIKLLTEYLTQRFGEAAKITHKKALNATCLSHVVRSEALGGSDGEELSYIDTFAVAEGASPDDEYGEDSFVLTLQSGQKKTLTMKSDGFMGLDMFLDGRKLLKGEAAQLTEDIRNGKVAKEYVASTKENVLSDEEIEKERKKRAAKARKELYKTLTEMDQPTREVVLGYAALSRDIDPDARREARKLADELACPKCQRKVASGAVCVSCEVAVVPRFGVDYMKFREVLAGNKSTVVTKLDKNGNKVGEITVFSPSTAPHPMAEAMSTIVPESELRNRLKRPEMQKNATALVDASEATPVEPVKATPAMDAVTRDALSKKLSDALFATLPEQIECPKCHQTLHKDRFGIRVARDRTTGIPARASRQSYCKPCRKP